MAARKRPVKKAPAKKSVSKAEKKGGIFPWITNEKGSKLTRL